MRARIHALWLTLLKEHTHRGEVAAAIWLGVVIGCSPLFGLHLPLCIALAWALRLNKIIVYAAANISFPPIAALLGFASVQLGMRLLHGRWLGLDLEMFRGRPLVDNAKAFFAAWLLGGTLIGVVLGGIFAGSSWLVLGRRDDRFHRAVRRAARRYRACPAKYRVYALLKYRMDPVYREVARHVPPRSHTVDFGAGLNMLGVFLDALGEERRSSGLEWDELKVAEAKRAAPEITIVQHDVREPMQLAPADVVSIIDMLHYFSRADVEKILRHASDLLVPGGTLLVRESVTEHRSPWTRGLEALAVKLGWNRAPGLRFLARQELQTLLEEAGFSVEARNVSGRLHPGNELFVCRRDLQRAPAL